MGASCCGGGIRRYVDECSTARLVAELAQRKDLTEATVYKDGSVTEDAHTLRKVFGPLPCVDSVAIRFERRHMLAWTVWGSVIRRNTGKYKGKLCLVGGVVNRHESIELALRRHWRADLGLTIDLPLGWDHPVFLRQYAPANNHLPDFLDDPEKHGCASVHLVTIPTRDRKDIKPDFGTKHGGQEACGFEWHTAESCPPDWDWGYNMRNVFLHALKQADTLRLDIQRFLDRW